MIADIIGTSAAILTCSSLVPQVWTAFRTRNLEALSLAMLVLLFCGKTLWLTYGLDIGSVPIVISNATGTVLVGSIMILKMWTDYHPTQRRLTGA